MEKIILLIFLTIVSVSAQPAPSMSCHPSMVDGEYTANFFITNMQEPPFNGFPKCEMTHFQGMRDDDVTRIIVSGNSRIIPTVVCGTFLNAKRLEAKYIQLNQIYHLFNCGNVVHLDLSNNDIPEIFPNSFTNQPYLKHLNLSSNRIVTTYGNSLINLDSLEVLDLSNNPETELADGFFQHVSNLKHLDISHSKIVDLKPSWFLNLTQLVQLDISNNPFAGIPAETFENLRNLEILDMSSCTLTELSDKTFYENLKLAHLDMSSNEFSSLEANLLRNQTYLVSLILSHNNLVDPLPGRFFESLRNLQTLELNNCNIAKFEDGWFRTTSELRTLSLNDNQIEEIPYRTFSNVNQIVEFYMVNNLLEVIDATSFGSLRNLRELRVDNNKISAVDSHFIKQPIELNTAWFLENPCVNENFDNFYQDRGSNLAKFEGCFINFDEIPIIRDTLPGEGYRFNSIRWETLVMHVKASENVSMILTEFQNENNPSLEIHIGVGRYYYVYIYENDTLVWEQAIDNIISGSDFKSFVITWRRNVLQFYQRDWQLSEAIHTIQSPFPINFFGIKADTHASFEIRRQEKNFKHADFPGVYVTTPATTSTTPASTIPV